MAVPEIFDRATRRRRRDRAAAGFAVFDFVRRAMLDGIDERLSAVTRRFRDVLEIGSFAGDWTPPAGARIARVDPSPAFARRGGAVVGDEDRLPLADASFDLVVSAGALDRVGDLPGALALARRVLRPDGLFLAAMSGAGSLETARAAFRAAEAERPVARFHPPIDVRAAGDLLVRAGFALPVADTETLDARYADLTGLVRDLRGMDAGNILSSRFPLRRDTLAAASTVFDLAADPDGRVRERFVLLFLTGWAPSTTQPQPARRGSGTVSLHDALRRR